MLGMGYSTSPHTHPIKSSILKAWLRLCNMLPHLEFQCVVDSVSTSNENYLCIAQYRVYNSENTENVLNAGCGLYNTAV